MASRRAPAKAGKKKAAKRSPKKRAPRKADTQKTGKRGMTPFRPTDEQRKQVELMVGLGLTYREISLLTINPRTGSGISVNTLQKHFPEELARGAPLANAQVARALFKKATSDSHPQAATCAIWWSKARMGWRSEQKLSVDVKDTSGVLVVPAAAATTEDWISEQAEADKDKQSPVE